MWRAYRGTCTVMRLRGLVQRTRFSTCSLGRLFQPLCRIVPGNSGPPLDGRKTHLELTAEQQRSDLTTQGQVVEVTDLSPTVKSITLRVTDPNFSFKAGQWVDFFIPGVETVGGFSICSPPSQLEQEGLIELAVKYGKWPPTYWIHTKCTVGSLVQLRVGGDFFFPPEKGSCYGDILLLAGGVGINPLVSILQYVHAQHQSASRLKGRLVLLYSAISVQELLFRELIDSICAANEAIDAKYFVTGSESLYLHNVTRGRIGHHALLSPFYPGKASSVYICGPPPMITDMELLLLDLGYDQSQIVYEKWW